MNHTAIVRVRLAIGIAATVAMAACFPLRGTPGFFEVTIAADAEDRSIGDAQCRSTLASGACTLRAAVSESNATPGENTIQLGEEEYLLSIPGHLVVSDDLRIIGSSPSHTTISGTARDGRIFLVDSARMWISDLSLTGGGSVANGGAMLVENRAFVSLANVVISNSHAHTGGGAIHLRDSNLVLLDSEITGNSAIGAFAGGLWMNEGATATIDRSTFASNSSNRCGAIYNFGSLRITNSTISGNSATSSGRGTGGIVNINVAHLNNVTIYGNRSDAFTGDSSSSGGVYSAGGARTTMSNTIIAGNTQGRATNDCRGEIVSYGYNLIEQPDGCVLSEIAAGNLFGRNPDLLPLRLNSGGVTRTHRPQSGSPVIGAGHPQVGSGVPNLGRCEPRDQAGRIRQLTGRGERCEIGSIEY